MRAAKRGPTSAGGRDPGLSALYRASIRGVLTMGERAGKRLVRFHGVAALSEESRDLDLVGTRGYGFDLHARASRYCAATCSARPWPRTG